ncbi:MAG: tRNA1(Val) (adenine(37)-N6)-methyltransferase [Deltaproteobacteria bacterium]|nr:tRNA1(Val) (adenine(37)-N6)-methyltransferase [Deltaproteobacteria bacterium]
MTEVKANDLADGEAVEDLLQGKLKIIQNEKGFRFSIDAILIAHFARIKKKDNIADLGTGSGVIPLILSYRYPLHSITGIEVDEAAVSMAKRSVDLNNLSEKVNILAGDIREIRTISAPEAYSFVIANPPYGKVGSGRLSEGLSRASARHEVTGGLKDFIKAGAYLLKYRGVMSIIYPAKRLADLMYEMRRCGIEPKRLRTVHSRKGDAAKLVMVEGVKGGGVEMEIEAPLYIYENEDRYTEEVKAMYL